MPKADEPETIVCYFCKVGQMTKKLRIETETLVKVL